MKPRPVDLMRVKRFANVGLSIYFDVKIQPGEAGRGRKPKIQILGVRGSAGRAG
jgi:hypothetical protein